MKTECFVRKIDVFKAIQFDGQNIEEIKELVYGYANILKKNAEISQSEVYGCYYLKSGSKSWPLKKGCYVYIFKIPDLNVKGYLYNVGVMEQDDFEDYFIKIQ